MGSERESGLCCDELLSRCFPEPEKEVDFRNIETRTGPLWVPSRSSTGGLRGQGVESDFADGFSDNSIHTAKYTVISFIPRGLFEQFRRVANVFFLVISCLMIIGDYGGIFLTPMSAWTTLGPLTLIIGLTLVKEGFEDQKRHKADDETNHRQAQILEAQPFATPGECQYRSEDWQDVKVGMVVKVEDRQEMPADMVPLMSSEEGGKCYVETANIDGETSLKLRQCAATGNNGGVVWSTPGELAAAEVKVQIQPPNPSIHAFEGTLQVKDDPRAVPLGPHQILLRGATLRNTKWILGLVVYTGDESKLVLNSRAAPSKLSIMESQVNSVIYFIFVVYFVLTTLTTIARAEWEATNAKFLWYICEGDYKGSGNKLFEENCSDSDGYADVSYWFTFLILFSNLLPISLYVTIETINIFQAFFVDQDLEMYDKELGVAAMARTSNMNGDLGQIEYIFSDKTGTLTCNEMKFRRCSVGGKIYGHGVDSDDTTDSLDGGVPPSLNASMSSDMGGPGMLPEESQAALAGRGEAMECLAALSLVALGAAPTKDSLVARSFVENMAVCHTVVVEQNEQTGTKSYQAESPDEEALVEGAKSLGWEYTSKRFDSTLVNVHSRGETSYMVMAVIEFDSTRKRMSTLVQMPETGAYKLFVKGADNIIKGLAAPNGFDHVGGKETLDAHLELFAADGLRTLVLAERNLDETEATAWLGAWRDAVTATSGRADRMEEVAKQIEKDLVIVGCTAIEDRLQDDVPATIANLGTAGVKLWVLTGDKMTTAIHIGHSCRLLNKDMHKLIVSADPIDENAGPPDPIDEQLAAAAAFLAEKHGAAFAAVDELLGEANPYQVPVLDTDELKAWLASFFTSCCGPEQLAGPAGSTKAANVALVIDGPSLTTVFKDNALVKQLLKIACTCRSVLACRVSPKQKQMIVRMVIRGCKTKPTTLAIGDGANDVGMIQEAQIGVGIRGKEGRQAVNNSDFAIAQFRFLKRLMMVHGRWNYRRMAKVIVYFFHKNIVITAVIFFFTTNCAYSGQSLFEDYLYAGYNFFLGVPPFCLGFFDKDISDKAAMTYFPCYAVGREKKDLNVRIMSRMMIHALLEGTFIYFLCKAAYLGSDSVWRGGTGDTADLQVFGTIVFSVMVTAMLAKVVLLHYTWNWLCVAGIIFSIWLYFFFLFVYGALYSISESFYWVPYHALCFAPFWLLCFLMGSSTSILDVILETIRYYVSPKYSDAVREAEHSPKSKLPCGDPVPEPDLPEGAARFPSLNPIQTSQHGFPSGEASEGGEIGEHEIGDQEQSHDSTDSEIFMKNLSATA